MNKKYAIYVRQSIDKPDSISIESQIERCRLEIENSSYAIYSDQGYSGKNTDRPGFQAMLEAIRMGEIQCVVCYKLDRCSRSVLDFTRLMDLFQKHDVGFVSCTEKFDTTTPMGRAMLSICVVFAQLERETIQQRIVDAYHSRCKKGYFMGGRIPFGFRLKPYVLDGKKTSCYEAIKNEVIILEKIYNFYQDPSASLADVVLHLEKENIRNPRRTDGNWVRPHIGRMIKNPIYVQADERIYHHFWNRNAVLDNPIEDYIGRNGCYLYQIDKEQHVVLAPHVGIISSDVWLHCQKGLQRQRTSSNFATPSSWLIGKLKCQKCGRSVVLKQTKNKYGRTYRYFVCPNSQTKVGKCDGFKPFSANNVELEISKAIEKRIIDLANRENTVGLSAEIPEIIRNLGKYCEHTSISPAQLEQILSDMKQLLYDSRPSNLPRTIHDRGTWERICQSVQRWEVFELDQKRKIADLLITDLMLTDAHIAVYWRY